ncbi:hypothetical protein [Gloeocapsa sp. PCC 73106]|uniref:hypothetical protein n=1 Tax=Gloeocapsa sp. PCC 73106 TaxID=102232 RepID=UPI0002ACF448|nr:hypothetical protein [Gloeocapsa sp. PCC 73106]ELR98910.1 hypothetical protein GLO73106DRAFT_00027500 [Gloeocapsa sp. PCC 73106]
MSAKPTLAFFPTRSSEGIDLQEQFVPLAEKLGFEVQTPSATQSNYCSACLNSDVVVFDASIEEEGQHNYANATTQQIAMDHILVISRTYLPINFFGLRDGGAPLYPGFQSNDYIISNRRKNAKINRVVLFNVI